ncbi:hypothetical protein HK104_002826 [Borealophlyctis nickersoniae]|nr:hypothetical protein HK104_002826 [Borealophlyctis nickersoniae]
MQLVDSPDEGDGKRDLQATARVHGKHGSGAYKLSPGWANTKWLLLPILIGLLSVLVAGVYFPGSIPTYFGISKSSYQSASRAVSLVSIVSPTFTSILTRCSTLPPPTLINSASHTALSASKSVSALSTFSNKNDISRSLKSLAESFNDVTDSIVDLQSAARITSQVLATTFMGLVKSVEARQSASAIEPMIDAAIARSDQLLSKLETRIGSTKASLSRASAWCTLLDNDVTDQVGAVQVRHNAYEPPRWWWSTYSTSLSHRQRQQLETDMSILSTTLTKLAAFQSLIVSIETAVKSFRRDVQNLRSEIRVSTVMFPKPWEQVKELEALVKGLQRSGEGDVESGKVVKVVDAKVKYLEQLSGL